MIRKLPESVINQIAAGEVIQRPYNGEAIKQLVQNAIDAAATAVQINIVQGGLKSIEIIDNGEGIQLEDFPLICSRFATSKISQIEDLQNLDSFGFRGEALASLSYVSQLEIISKRKDANIAYRASFKNEKIDATPEMLPFNQGTKIIAKDLFGTLQTRKSSLNPNQEKKRIIKLIQHFALHYHTIKFRLESQKGVDFSIDNCTKKKSEAKMIAFQQIVKLPFEKFIYIPLTKMEISNLSIEAVTTKINSCKGKQLYLNINNRIIENTEIYKAVEGAYSECYRSIHEENETFCSYISLNLNPKVLDCNVHPTKKMVGFYSGQKIYEAVKELLLSYIKNESSVKQIIAVQKYSVGSQLLSQNPIDTFRSKISLKSQKIFGSKMQTHPIQKSTQQQFTKPGTGENFPLEHKISSQQPQYAYNKTRTDFQQLPIKFYFKQQTDQSQVIIKESKLHFVVKDFGEDMKQQIYIRQFFRQIVYVGCFNLNFMLLQYNNELHLLNLMPFLPGFIAQYVKKVPLEQYHIPQKQQPQLTIIILAFLKDKKLINNVNAQRIINRIINKKQQIIQKYGINIKDGFIQSFPILHSFMSDSIDYQQLAYFLCRLVNKQEINVYEQQEYFFYFMSTFMRDTRNTLSPLNDVYSKFMRDEVVPLLKTSCRFYDPICITKYLKKMLDLKDIYKIFERC